MNKSSKTLKDMMKAAEISRRVSISESTVSYHEVSQVIVSSEFQCVFEDTLYDKGYRHLAGGIWASQSDEQRGLYFFIRLIDSQFYRNDKLEINCVHTKGL